MPVAPGKSVGYAVIGASIYLYVGARKAPTDADWNDYISFLQRQLKNLKPGVAVPSIVYERGTGPTAAQRKLLTDATSKFKPLVAVIAPSAVARGIVTALSWFNSGYKAFTPDELDGAFQHVGVPRTLVEEVRKVIRALEKEMDAAV